MMREMSYVMGTIIPNAGAILPTGFMHCDGKMLSKDEYPALFALLGTQFGGNGNPLFALPDLRGRVPIGKNNHWPIGATMGQDKVSLSLNEIPGHSHQLLASSSNAYTGVAGANATLAEPAEDRSGTITLTKGYNDQAVNTALHVNTLSVSGSSEPHENRQPFLVLSYIICVQGLFPRRTNED